MSADFEKKMWFSGDLWIIFSHVTPFFWVVNISMTNVEACMPDSSVVSAKTMHPQMKATASRCKGVISYFYPVYSPGHSSNNYLIMIMSHLDCIRGSYNALADLSILMVNWRGLGLTWIRVGSCLG